MVWAERSVYYEKMLHLFFKRHVLTLACSVSVFGWLRLYKTICTGSGSNIRLKFLFHPKNRASSHSHPEELMHEYSAYSVSIFLLESLILKIILMEVTVSEPGGALVLLAEVSLPTQHDR